MIQRSMWLMLLGLVLPAAVFAQGTNEEFGQNRVQYKHFEWSYFDSENFTTFFYLGGQELGKYSIIYAETVLPEIKEILEFRLNTKIDILVYNDLSDLNQTNIGQGLDLNNTGGLTKIIDNKIFVYFDGDHGHLEAQIRRGIAQVFINHMLFGTSFQEVLQNAVLLNLPPWFSDGLASYIGESWTPEMDDRLRDGILSGRFKKISKLKGEEARFAGHAFWHYVEMKYGKTSVPNLLYLTRINRSLESGFLFVLGGSVENVMAQWYNEMYAQFKGNEDRKELLLADNVVQKKAWKKRAHYQVKMSDDGKYVAFVTNILGQYRVHVMELEDGGKGGKTKRVLKGGHKTITLVTDHSYPLLAWSPDKQTLAIIYNQRDNLKMVLYNAETGKKDKRRITKFQQIHDFSFTNNPNTLVLSAVNMGHTDIYLYDLPSTTVQLLTNDFYDDLYPAYIKMQDREGIIFSSNRISDTLKPQRLDTTLLGKQYDLYFYDLNDRTALLSRLTFSNNTDETMPMQYNDSLFAFISNKNGIANRFVGYFKTIEVGKDTVVFFKDSTVTNPAWNLQEKLGQDDSGVDSFKINPQYKHIGVTYPNSNYAQGILEHDISPSRKITLEMFRDENRYRFYINPLPENPDKDVAPKLENTEYKQYLLKQVEKEKKAEETANKTKKTIQEPMPEDPEVVQQDTVLPQDPVSSDYYFQNDWNTSPNLKLSTKKTTTIAGGTGGVDGDGTTGAPGGNSIFQATKVLPYRLQFSTDYIVTQIDNSLIMTRYEIFRPGVPVFNNPALSGMINLGIADLFEDIRITGGLRFPFNFQGSEYFISFENLRKRWDKKFTYYRKVDKQQFSPDDILPFVGTSAPASYPANLAVEAKVKTNYAEMRLKFPIDVIKSLRFYLAYRNDTYVYQSMERFTLELPTYNENWLFAKVEYVHDKTIKVGTNLFNGFRFKVWGEIHKQFTMEDKTILNDVDIKLPSFDNRYFAVFGIDFRYYQKIHKDLTWCTRFAMGTSVGTRKLIYYLGGVDSWIAPKFNQDIPVNQNNNYAFQTVVNNMRGFDQNIRNGNSYAVINSEIRWPIFSYLLNRTIRSEFIKNFQLVGFTDVGTAWEGRDPYDENNPLFIDEIKQDPVTVRVEYFRNPIVVGYGFGARSTLFGYYLRFDVAWGKDTGNTVGPKFYFSLAMDF